MLEIVQFENGRYGFRNKHTGIVVNDGHEPRTFRWRWQAERVLNKMSKRIGAILKDRKV